VDALLASPWSWVIAGGVVVAAVYGAALWIDWRRQRPTMAPLRDVYIESLLSLAGADPRRGEALLARAIDDQPSDALAFLLYGTLLTKRGEAARAARLLEGLLARNDLDSMLAGYAREGLVEALVRAGRIDAAASSCRRLQSDSVAEGERVERRVRLAFAARAYDVADGLIARLERLDRARGARLTAFSLAAQAEDTADAGRRDEALKLVRKALTRDDGVAAAWALEGVLLLESGKVDRARASFLEALKREPRLGLVVFPPLEDAHIELGRVADYEAMVEALLEARPRDPIALWALGCHWVRRRHFPEGVKALTEAVEAAPDFWHARRELVRAQAELEERTAPADFGTPPSTTLCQGCRTPGVHGILRCPICGQVGSIVFTFAAPALAAPASLPASESAR